MNLNGLGDSPIIGTTKTQMTTKSVGVKPDEDPKLRKATQQMESLFVGMLMKQMHNSASKSALLEGKNEGSMYREMFDDAVAEKIGKQGSFGISNMLYNNIMLRRNSTVTSAEANSQMIDAAVAEMKSKSASEVKLK